MANKIIYDINGKIKEIATTHMSASDDGSSLFINKLSFNTASINLPNGLLIVGADGNMSSSAGARDGDIVSWNVVSGSWVAKPDEINISTLTASSGDLYSGEQYNNIRVKSLSNVSSGTLGIVNGGTGIPKEEIVALGSNDQALLIGNGTQPLAMIKKSSQGDLTKKPVLMVNSSGDGWTYLTQSVMQVNMDIQVFNTPGSHTWNKPANTKMIRVLAQGAGGGGGSGANRNKLVNFLGGAGGSGGAFVDSGIILFNDSQVSITVGSGGIGGNIPYNQSAGLSGLDGESSSFGSYVIANGGRGGAGGNINSSTTSSGGLPVAGSSVLENNVLVYNNSFTLSNVSGSPNTLTIGNNANSDSYLLTQRGGSSGGSNSYNGGYGLYDLSETDFTSSYLFYFNSSTSVSNLANSSHGLTIQNSSGFTISNDSPFNDGTKSLQVIVPSLTVPYINLSNPPNLSYDDFTYEVWAYFSSFATTYSSLLTTLSTATPTYLRLNVLSNGKIQCGYVNATGGAFESQYTTTTSVQLNKWTHIALCRKGNNMYIFIDGISHQFTLSLFRTFKLDSEVIFLGVQGPNASDVYKASAKYCNFRITNKCIYNTSFNTSEIILSSNKTSSLYQENYFLPESDLNLSNSNYSINNGIYIHNGSTGGNSYTVTETFDSGTYGLYHANLNSPTIDNSIYGQSVLSGSANGIKIISTASLSIPQLSGSGWSDGIISSSAWNNTAGTASSLYLSPGYNFGTGPWSLESWFYLNNTGSSGEVGTSAASCYLFGAGFAGAAVGALLTVTSSAGIPKLRIWSNGTTNTITSSVDMPINQWCHIVLQKSGSNMQAYINGTSSINVALAPTVNGTFGYSLGTGTNVNHGRGNFNGYAKELRLLNRAQTPTEIAQNYTNVITNVSGPYNNISFINEYPGGTGGDGAWGSGGGGGGASTNATSNLTTYDAETISLIHSDLSDGSFKDKSIYNNTTYNTNKQIVSTASVGIPAISPLMPDGVLSSSAGVQLTGNNYAGTYVTTNTSVTDNFTLESWFYLKNSGSLSPANDGYISCYLLNAGYNTSNLSLGLLLGIQQNTNLLRIWANAVFPTNNLTNLTMSYNQWNHVVMQKSGTNVTIYLNGTGSTLTGVTSTTTNNHFAYSLGGSSFQNYDFNGYAKEFVLTNRIKSASEIQDYYNAVKSNLSGAYSTPAGIQQGGNGGDGYVAVISYKDF